MVSGILELDVQVEVSQHVGAGPLKELVPDHLSSFLPAENLLKKRKFCLFFPSKWMFPEICFMLRRALSILHATCWGGVKYWMHTSSILGLEIKQKKKKNKTEFIHCSLYSTMFTICYKRTVCSKADHRNNGLIRYHLVTDVWKYTPLIFTQWQTQPRCFPQWHLFIKMHDCTCKGNIGYER